MGRAVVFLACLMIAVAITPAVLVQSGNGSSSLTIDILRTVQQQQTGLVLIEYEITHDAPVRFDYREEERDAWHSIDEEKIAVGNVAAGRHTARWNPRSDDNSIIDTDDAQIRIVAETGVQHATVVSLPFKLDTRPPLGCSCGYPGYREENVPLEALFIASVPEERSPPIAYRFRLGRAGQEEPLIVTNWRERNRWSPSTLTPATEYWWQVQARDIYGNSAGWSVPVQFTTVSAAAATSDERPNNDDPMADVSPSTHEKTGVNARSTSLMRLVALIAVSALILVGLFAGWRRYHSPTASHS